MGLTHVTAAIANLTKSRPAYEAEFLVDTGAIDCMAPAGALRKAGLKAEHKAAYERADGRSVEFPVGFARISFLGFETVCQVVFGPEDCEPLLGVVALENVGIAVDPVTHTLKAMAAKPLK